MASIQTIGEDREVIVRDSSDRFDCFPTSLTIHVGRRYGDGEWHNKDEVMILFESLDDVIAFAGEIIKVAEAKKEEE